LTKRYTLNDLIELYQADEHSSFAMLKSAVRIKRERVLARLSRERGDVCLQVIRPRTLKDWHQEWRGTNKIAAAHAMISHLRVLFQFGATILEDGECARLLLALAEMRFERSSPRKQTISSEQSRAFRKKAHWRGWNFMALAQALQFELLLPQKEVIGQWVSMSEPVETDVSHSKFGKWLGGIRWEQVDNEFVLHHSSNRYLLRNSQMVMEELAILAQKPIASLVRDDLSDRGPVIFCEVTGLPYRTSEFRRKWRLVADLAGLPRSVTNRDNRRATRD
jgi:hypothetical protein